MTAPAHPYRYPAKPHVRRHGPVYSRYESYLPWLEDEFTFRCVYCLKRQAWASTELWAVEHLVPVAEDKSRECDYTNLVLACPWCNSRKLAAAVPDPHCIAYGDALRINDETGEVIALNDDGRELERILKLNHPRQKAERLRILRTLQVLAEHDFSEWKKYMGFPERLPDLKRREPNANTREAGLEESWFERRNRKPLPDFYE